MKTITTIILAIASLATFAQQYRVVGTGRTTGHIVDISIQNPTSQPITAFIPNDGNLNNITVNGISIFDQNPHRGQLFFIPATGKDQPYVATSATPPAGTAPGNINIPPGDSLHIPVNGYCADVSRLPVGSGQPTVPISTWIGGDGNIPPPGSGIPDGFAPARKPDAMPFVAANVPNQIPDKPLVTSFDKNPDAVEYLFHAITEITRTYDSLDAIGAISTPFSGNPPKEREAVIQQTFWIYTSTITGEPYTKPQFRDRMVSQYEDNTGTKIENAPAATADKIDQGVDDFWGTFTAVGVEAKVISVNASFPHSEEMENVFGKDIRSGVSAKTGDAAKEAAGALGSEAFETGEDVAFKSGPDRTTAASEVAHVDQRNQGRATGGGKTEAHSDSLASALEEALRKADPNRESVGAAVARGAEAGATTSNHRPPATASDSDTPPPPETSKSCACGPFSAQISLPRIHPDGRYTSVNAEPGENSVARAEIQIGANELRRAPDLEVKVGKVNLSCTCQSAPCPVIHLAENRATGAAVSGVTAGNLNPAEQKIPDNPQGAAATGQSAPNTGATPEYRTHVKSEKLRLKDPARTSQVSNGEALWEFAPIPPRPGTYPITVEIEARCGTANCPPATCKTSITINVEVR